MSNEIKVGDLVVVVGSHCAGFSQEAAGITFSVEQIIGPRPFTCSHCRGLDIHTCAVGGDDWQIPLQYLKRIPPLSELESEKHREELTA